MGKFSLSASYVPGRTTTPDVRATGIEKEAKKFWSGRTLWYRLFPVCSSVTRAATFFHPLKGNCASQDREWAVDVRTMLLRVPNYPGACCPETSSPCWTKAILINIIHIAKKMVKF